MNRLLLMVLLLLGASVVKADAQVFDALREGGHVVLLRHALAPGIGDPAGFSLDDCSTQRNLSAEGRAQAKALGEWFRAEGFAGMPVYTSQWCRAWDTAQGLGLGEPVHHPGLDTFFHDRGRRDAILADLNGLLEDLRVGSSAVLVTHQVNITALAGGGVGSGEGVVLRLADGGEVVVIGRLRLPPQ